MTWNLKANIRGPQGIQGVQGIPGVNGIENATAIASYLNDPASNPAKTAADKRYQSGVSPKAYGALGDGVTDDTTAINACITANPRRVISFGDAAYVVSAAASGSDAIKLNQPGVILDLRGATIKLTPNAFTNYQIINISAADCKIIGGTILGDVGTHTGTTGEWGYGLCVSAGADRFIADGVYLTKCWGDGITILGRPKDVLIRDCIADANRRLGMSIIDAIRPRVEGGAYINTGTISFTAPGGGIDIEPDASSTRDVLGAILTGVIFEGNVGPGLLLSGTNRTLTATVTGCRAIGNGGTTYPGFDIEGSVTTVHLTGCTADGNGLSGFRVQANVAGANLVACDSRNNKAHGFHIIGVRAALTAPVAVANFLCGIFADTTATDTTVTGGTSRGNGLLTNNVYPQVDNYGVNTSILGHASIAGAAANKPSYGFANRSTASGARFIGCDASGPFPGGYFIDQTTGTTAVTLPKMGVARAAAITTPTSDTVGTKVAIDAIRTALANFGITA